MLVSFKNGSSKIAKQNHQLKQVIKNFLNQQEKCPNNKEDDKRYGILRKFSQIFMQESISSCNSTKSLTVDKIAFLFSTSSKDQPSNFSSFSPHIKTLFNQSNQHAYLLKLINTFTQQSLSSYSLVEKLTIYPSKQLDSLLFSPLKNLSLTIGAFLKELQAEQTSQISKWQQKEIAGKQNSKDHTVRQYIENFTIEIEEKKLFYKRLDGFLQDVMKEIETILDKENYNNSTKTQNKAKNHTETQQKPTLVQGDFFRHNFITENYTQIFDGIDQYKEDYLMKSKKLKNFNFLNVKEYESNYGLKLRFLIKVLAEIKQIYQVHLLSEYYASTTSKEPLYPSVNEFLSKTVITPQQYSQLLSQYFMQFSEKAIQNHLFMSIGYHSADTSQLSKELIDVKIRETRFKYDLKKMTEVYRMGQNQWLFNGVGKEQQEGQADGDASEDNIRKKDAYAFDMHKKYVLDYAKLVIKEIRNNKENLNQQQHFNQAQHYLSSTSKQAITLKPQFKPKIFLHSSYSITFNQLLPHNFFTISDIVQLLPLIQEQIIPLMINPHQTYQKMLQEKKFKLENSNDLTKNKHVLLRYKRELNELMRQVEENMVFLSRFLQCDIQMIVHHKNFLKDLYANQFAKIHDNFKWLKDVRQSDLNQKFPHFQILKVTHLSKFLRAINITYQMLNKLNPIYIEDCVNSIQEVESTLRKFVLKEVCKQVDLNQIFKPIELVELLDRMFLPMMKDRLNLDNLWCVPLLRFRVLATFLDVKLITEREFFILLINTKKLQQLKVNMESNPLLNYLYYSDGLEKTLYILALFRDKQEYKQFVSSSQEFRNFEKLIYGYQQKFNFVIQKFENLDDGDLSEKDKKKHQEVIKSMKFYQENDMLHRFRQTDDQVFVNWLDETLTQHNQVTLAQTQQPPTNSSLPIKPHRLTFQNPLNILLILSQNVNFLSSTIQMSYFNYLKSQIQAFYSFDRFVSTWNFPFCADIALQKRRISSNNVERMYLKMLTVEGFRGRGRFFREEVVLKRDFMRFNRFNDHQGKDRNFDNITIKRQLIGIRSTDKELILLKFPIGESLSTINLIKSWLGEEKFNVAREPKKIVNPLEKQEQKSLN